MERDNNALDGAASLKDTVKQMLRNKIIGLQYQPKQRIVEMEIARELQISHIPVREALCGLAEEGFVKSIKHKGTFVTEIDHKEAYYMFWLRADIEAKIIGLILPKLTKRDFGELHDIVDAIQNANDTYENYSPMSSLDSEFHRTLVGKGNIQSYNRIWDMLNCHVRRFINYAHPKAEYTRTQVFQTHRRLLEIFEERKVDLAQNALRSHILDVFDKGIIRLP